MVPRPGFHDEVGFCSPAQLNWSSKIGHALWRNRYRYFSVARDRSGCIGCQGREDRNSVGYISSRRHSISGIVMRFANGNRILCQNRPRRSGVWLALQTYWPVTVGTQWALRRICLWAKKLCQSVACGFCLHRSPSEGVPYPIRSDILLLCLISH